MSTALVPGSPGDCRAAGLALGRASAAVEQESQALASTAAALTPCWSGSAAHAYQEHTHARVRQGHAQAQLAGQVGQVLLRFADDLEYAQELAWRAETVAAANGLPLTGVSSGLGAVTASIDPVRRQATAEVAGLVEAALAAADVAHSRLLGRLGELPLAEVAPAPPPSPEPRPHEPEPEDGGFSWGGLGHLVLDGVGLVPIVGEPADAVNAAWYAAEGDYTNAALSAAATVPIAGWVATGGKFGVRGVRAVRSADGAHAWLKGRPSMVPRNATEELFTPEVNFIRGQRYKWTDPATGKTVRYHAHGPDPGRPATDNAGAGPIYRHRVGNHYLDAQGNQHTRNSVDPHSSAFNSQAANDTHIPFPLDQPRPDLPYRRGFVPNLAGFAAADDEGG